MIDHDLDIEGKLIPAILDAVGGDKKRNGAVASVMNALIGACCYHATNISRSDTEDGYNDDEYASIKSLLSDRVNTLLLSYENLEETSGISPDIVSYCLAYTALLTDPKEQVLANTILDVARKKSKKIAGGKRRKTLSSSRRKEVSTFTDAELKLKELLGNEFEILLETDEFAVVNKPAGVPCFHRKATTAGKIRRGRKGTDNGVTKSDISLEDALVACNVPLSTLNPDACGLVHRLDRGSSGCMVVAKSDEMHAQLVSEFFLRRTTKKYKTLVQQKPSSSISDDDVGWIDQPVDNRPALSKYRILERYPSERNVALLEFEIFTGRKHQIRVHAAEALSSPVLNDFLYSHNERHDDNRAASSRKNDGQFFLHAFHLSIPRFGIKVEAPVPLWWDETITELKIHQQ
jgi:23S rRNA-/tRNA-specific pseudouridylate synthase